MKKLIYVFMFVLMSLLVVAVPPQQLEALQGLTLETNIIQQHPINTTFFLHTHVFDSNYGTLLNGASAECFYHAYSQQSLWNHIDTGNLTSYGAGYFANLNESLFNTTGLYSIMLWCQSETGAQTQGGFKQFTFNVYETGKLDVAKVWVCKDFSNNYIFYVVLGIGILLLILTFVIRESLIGILAGVMIIASYFFIGACAPLLFAPILLIGLLLVLRFSFL